MTLIRHLCVFGALVVVFLLRDGFDGIGLRTRAVRLLTGSMLGDRVSRVFVLLKRGKVAMLHAFGTCPKPTPPKIEAGNLSTKWCVTEIPECH